MRCVLSHRLALHLTQRCCLSAEPDIPTQGFNNVSFLDCTLNSNAGSGFNMYLRRSDHTSPPVSVLIRNCSVDGAGRGGFDIGAMSPGVGAGGSGVQVDNCHVRNTTTPGLNIFDKAATGPSVVVKHSSFVNVGTNRTITYPCPPNYRKLHKCSADRVVPMHDFCMVNGLEPKHPGAYSVGGLILTNVSLTTTNDRAFLLLSSPNKFGFVDGGVRGDVTVTVSGAAKAADVCAVPALAAKSLVATCSTSTGAKKNTLADLGFYYGMEPRNSLTQFANFSTSAFLTDGAGDVPATLEALADRNVAELKQLASLNMSGVLPCDGVFFEFSSGSAHLRQNWSANWHFYWSKVSPYAANIRALYPADEPPPAMLASGVYAKVVSALHASAPNIDIAAVVTQSAVKGMAAGAYELPAEVTLIGFDAYNCWAEAECKNHGLCCWENRTMPQDLAILKTYVQKRPNSSIVVIPGGVASSGKAASPQPPSVLDQQLRVHRDQMLFEWCAKEDLCVSMWVFIWNSLHTSTGWLVGVETQPLVKKALTAIGSQIKHGEISLKTDDEIDADGHCLRSGTS